MNKKARSRKFTSAQSTRLGAYFAAGVAASTAATSPAEAEIIYFDVYPPRTIGYGNSMYFGAISLSPATYTFNSSNGNFFGLAYSSQYNRLYSYQSTIAWGAGSGLGQPVLKLSDGATIDAGAIPSWNIGYALLTDRFSGYWTGGANAYAALRIDAGGGNYNYGWVSINYDTNSLTATISGFAFEGDINTPIEAGATAPIPEPGTWATGAGLFALAVGAHLRRRREKKAAASDALLNLAAGAHGVEKFRTDKAA
jgi:hypothetical protein